MNIELKNISTNLRFSEETTMFKADLYVDKKKIAYCKNDGRGGNTLIYPYNKTDWDIINKLELHFKSLPPIKSPFTFEGHEIEMEQSLEGFVDDLVEKHLKEKSLKSKMNKGIVFENAKGELMYCKFKNGDIKELLTTDNGRRLISDTIAKLKKENCQILNTNIPAQLK